jgi:hypothetical protein
VFRTDLNQERSVVISDPLGLLNGSGPINGSLVVASSTQFWGLEFNAVAGNLCSGVLGKLDALVGVRYLDLRDQLELDLLESAPQVGTETRLFDRFSTSNRFYGAQVGVHSGLELGIVSFDLTGKVAMGCTHESSVINGATTVTGPGAPALPSGPGTFRGGIFTAPSNIGHISQDVFSVVPQVQARIGVRLCDMIRLFAAYDFLYWTDTVRPGNQIDRAVNFTQLLGGTLVGPPAPLPHLTGSYFWAQGVTMGMEICF